MIKKGLIFIVFLLIIIIWQSVSMYVSVQSDKNDGLQELITHVQTETNVTIHSAERFHGEQLYTIFIGNDENEQLTYLVVDSEQEIQQLSVQEITLDRADAPSLASSQFSELIKIIRVNPAFSDHQFTWEVLAEATDNRLQYIYYGMKDGAFQKRYILSK